MNEVWILEEVLEAENAEEVQGVFSSLEAAKASQPGPWTPTEAPDCWRTGFSYWGEPFFFISRWEIKD